MHIGKTLIRLGVLNNNNKKGDMKLGEGEGYQGIWKEIVGDRNDQNTLYCMTSPKHKQYYFKN